DVDAAEFRETVSDHWLDLTARRHVCDCCCREAARSGNLVGDCLQRRPLPAVEHDVRATQGHEACARGSDPSTTRACDEHHAAGEPQLLPGVPICGSPALTTHLPSLPQPQ